jgi:outer membrane protein assembly factor BamB
MFPRLSWLWFLIAVPLVAVAGIVAADIVRSLDAPEPEQQSQAAAPAPKKELPPCCDPGSAFPVNFQGQAAAAQGKDPLPQATFGNGPGRNLVNTIDKNIPADWSVEEGKQKNIKWSANLGKETYTTPVVAGGRLYIGTNNQQPRDPKVKDPRAVLMCFDAKSGKFLWQNLHDMGPEDIVSAALHCGLCSTPTVEGNFIYYSAPMCQVICAHADTGKIAWTYDMMKELKVFPCYLCNCSPLVVGDLIFVMTGNGRDTMDNLVAPKAPSFIALHKKTGTLAWKSDLPGDRIIEGQWSNPAYAVVKGKPQVIFAGGDGWIYGLNPANGDMIWKFHYSPKVDRAKETPGYVLATPVVYQDRVYFGTGAAAETGKPSPKSGHFFCLDLAKTGDVSCKNDNFDSKAPENKDSALVWHYGGFIVPKPAKSDRPDNVYFGRTQSTAAIHDGLCYIAEEKGYLHCLDAATGQRYWVHDFKTGISVSPYWVDGKIYMATSNGDMFVFAHGKELRQLATNDMDDSMEATPTAADGVLFIATKSKLYAIGNGK